MRKNVILSRLGRYSFDLWGYCEGWSFENESGIPGSHRRVARYVYFVNMNTFMVISNEAFERAFRTMFREAGLVEGKRLKPSPKSRQFPKRKNRRQGVPFAPQDKPSATGSR